MALAQRTIKGIFWIYTSYFGGRIMTLITTAILARLLAPDDFGVIQAAMTFIVFLELFSNIGVNDALIYNTKEQEQTADTVFIINVGLGVVQFVLALLIAPFVGDAFNDPRGVTIVQALAFTLIIDSFGRTHDALMQKELQFRRRVLPELLSSFIKSVVSVLCALAGWGLWSLVAGAIVGSLARTISKWWVLRWVPRLRFYWGRVKDLWQYTTQILLFQLLGVALDQADQMMIGVLLGTLQLGFYSIAMRIPELIIANFSLILTRVLFPTYVKLKDDISALSDSFLMTTRYTAYVTVPIGLGLVAVAPELVLVVFGDDFVPAIILLQVLALMGLVSTLPWSVGDILKAIGRPDISTKLLVIEALYTFPLIYILVSQSNLAVMAAIANLIALSITAVIRLSVVTRFLQVTWVNLIGIFRSPFIAGGVMLLVVTLWREVIVDWNDILVLVSSALVGAGVYAGLMWVLERKVLREGAQFMWELIQRRRQGDDDDDDEDEDEIVVVN